MAAAVARPPYADTRGVGLGKCLRERDRIAVVADLTPRIDFLARLAAARAEISVVEDQRRQSRGGKGFRELVEIHFFDGGKPVGHHDGRRLAREPVRQIVPPLKRQAVLCLEINVLSHRFLPSFAISRSQLNVRAFQYLTTGFLVCPVGVVTFAHLTCQSRCAPQMQRRAIERRLRVGRFCHSGECLGEALSRSRILLVNPLRAEKTARRKINWLEPSTWEQIPPKMAYPWRA